MKDRLEFVLTGGERVTIERLPAIAKPYLIHVNGPSVIVAVTGLPGDDLALLIAALNRGMGRS